MSAAGTKIATATNAIATRMAARRAIQIADTALQAPEFQEPGVTDVDHVLLMRAALARARVALEPARTVACAPPAAPWEESNADVPGFQREFAIRDASPLALTNRGTDFTFGVAEGDYWCTNRGAVHVNAFAAHGLFRAFEVDGVRVDTDPELALA